MPAGTSTGQGSDNQTGNSSHTGAIAGGVVGGLLGLAVIGAGVWIFLRKRAKARAGLGYPDYTSVATGAPVSDQGQITPSSQRLYVSLFVFHPARVLTDIHRTRPIHQRFPVTPTTRQVGHTRLNQIGDITAVSRNCERPGNALFSPPCRIPPTYPRCNLSFLLFFYLIYANRGPAHMCVALRHYIT